MPLVDFWTEFQEAAEDAEKERQKAENRTRTGVKKEIDHYGAGKDYESDRKHRRGNSPVSATDAFPCP